MEPVNVKVMCPECHKLWVTAEDNKLGLNCPSCGFHIDGDEIAAQQ